MTVRHDLLWKCFGPVFLKGSDHLAIALSVQTYRYISVANNFPRGPGEKVHEVPLPRQSQNLLLDLTPGNTKCAKSFPGSQSVAHTSSPLRRSKLSIIQRTVEPLHGDMLNNKVFYPWTEWCFLQARAADQVLVRKSRGKVHKYESGSEPKMCHKYLLDTKFCGAVRVRVKGATQNYLC